MILHVKHRPVPAPRQNRSDRWKQRPCVMEYRKYRDAVSEAFKNAEGEVPETPWAILYHFAIPGHGNEDFDNLIKSINDALVYHGHVPDDNRHYINVCSECVVLDLCSDCPERKKKRGGGYHADCGKIKQCIRGFARIEIISSGLS